MNSLNSRAQDKQEVLAGEKYGGIMQGSPPPHDQCTTLENWDTPPYHTWAFQNMSRIFPVAPVSRGNGPVWELPRNLRDLSAIVVTRIGGSETTVDGILAETNTNGFLVLHRGDIIAEKYFNSMTPDTLHLAQSVSKSIVGTLVGIYVDRGLVSLNEPVDTYIPELGSCGYEGATVSQVLNMKTGVKFNEDYTDPNAEFALLDMAAGWKKRKTGDEPETIYDLLVSVSRERDHGKYFQYRSIDTDVLAWVCERVGGAHLSELIGREIWSKLGCERDASFTVDKAGTALADGGFNATLRDYGRFGQMHLDQGLFHDHRLLSEDWVRSCRRGEVDAFKVLYGAFAEHYPKAAYSNQWWVVDCEREMYSARGVFGQMIYIDPSAELVVVKLSTWPNFLEPEMALNTYRTIEAIAAFLSEA